MRTLIKNTSIVTQNEKRDILENFDVLIKNDIIYKIDKEINIKDMVRVISGIDMFIAPGLINLHTHLWESGYKDFFEDFFSLKSYIDKTDKIALGSKKNLEKQRWHIAEYSIMESILSGTTTIGGGRLNNIPNTLGIRNYSFYMIMKNNKLKNEYNNFEKKFLSEYQQGTTKGIFIHSLCKVQPDILKKIANIHQKTQCSICIHIGETLEEEKTIIKTYWLSSLCVLEKYNLLNDKTLLVHCCEFKEEDFKKIKEKKAKIVHCLTSNLRVATNTIKSNTIKKYRNNICIATDGLITSWWLNMQREMNYNYLIHNRFEKNILSSQEIYDMGTIIPATFTGYKIWSIQKGYFADIVFYKKTSKKYIQDIVYYQQTPIWVMINGDIKFRKENSDYTNWVIKNFLYIQNKLNENYFN